MNAIVCAVAGAVVGVMLAGNASLAAINTPAGLNPGDKFHLAFVTTGSMEALSFNPPGYGYDQFVQNEALANGLDDYHGQYVNWIALISHWDIPVVGAINRFNPVFPVYRLDGAKIADDGADLYDGSIQNRLHIGPDLVPTDAFVWTGSNPDGTPAAGAYLNAGFQNVRMASNLSTNNLWISATDFPWQTELHVYAVSSVLIAVPEPTTMLLVGSGLLGVAATRRRTRRS